MYIVTNTSNRIISFRLNQEGETVILPIGAVVKVEKDKVDSLGESNLGKLRDYLKVDTGVGVKTTEDIKKLDTTQKEEFDFLEKLESIDNIPELKEEFGEYITNSNIKNIQKLKKHIQENKF